jgi:hypothetical protein
MNENTPKGSIRAIHIVECGCCYRTQQVRGTKVKERKIHALRMGWYITPEYGWTCPNHKTVAEVLKTAKDIQAEINEILGTSQISESVANDDTTGVHTCHVDCPCQQGGKPIGDFEGE